MSVADRNQGAVANSTSVPALVAGLGELPSLMVATDAIDEVVWETAMLAVRASEQIDACGVTVLREGKPVSLLPATAPYAELEGLQYTTDDGPAMESMRSRQAVSVPNMREDTRWGDYSRHASTLGVSSSLSLPLVAGDLRHAARAP